MTTKQVLILSNKFNPTNVKRFLLPLFLAFIIIPNAQGQEKDVSYGNQQWIQYYNEIRLTENWSWLTDGGFRWSDGLSNSSQYIVRTGAGYTINPDFSISAGVAQLGFYTDNELNRFEFRPYQEMNLTNHIGSIDINHRYRIEQRFFCSNENGLFASSNTFNFRFRYGITFSILVVKLSEESPDKAIFLNIGNEIFINAGSDVTNNVFDQNRFTISPTLQLSEQLSFSFTWNIQYAGTSTPGDFNADDVFWLQIKHNLDFTE